jgi:pentatricopeptide repeat protein
MYGDSRKRVLGFVKTRAIISQNRAAGFFCICTQQKERCEAQKDGLIETHGWIQETKRRDESEAEAKMKRVAAMASHFRDDIVALLKMYGKRKDLEKGRELHAEILQQKLLGKDLYMSNALISLYAKCGELETAQQVLEESQNQDVVSWNALISGYVQEQENHHLHLHLHHHHHHQIAGCAHRALHCFRRMQQEGHCPSAVTFACLLKACGSIGASGRGREMHAAIAAEASISANVIVGTALVDMYAKCGDLGEARQAFGALPAPTIISWNALMAGFVQHGHSHEALGSFRQMLRKGLAPNSVTFLCAIKACGSIGAIEEGDQIHATIIREGLLEGNLLMGTALIEMHARFGSPCVSQQVFDQLHVRDIAAWNALIAAYLQNGSGEQAMERFEEMRHEGLSPDAVTLLYALKACGSCGAADKGDEVLRAKPIELLLQSDLRVATATIDMYAKCGAISKAREVFEGIRDRDVAAWNAMLAGYAQQQQRKHGCSVMELFDKMVGEGIAPDSVTFTAVLNACNHSGLLEEAEMCFEAMVSRYCFTPMLEHHSCLVGLYGRAGLFDKVLAHIDAMPSLDYLPLWTALLGACQKCDNAELGNVAFQHVLQLDDTYATAYVCMGNIYFAAFDARCESEL